MSFFKPLPQYLWVEWALNEEPPRSGRSERRPSSGARRPEWRATGARGPPPPPRGRKADADQPPGSPGRNGICLNDRRPPAVFVCQINQERRPPITIKTILNKVHPLKRFVYSKVFFSGNGELPDIVAEVEPRANSKPRCSCCGKPAPGYDRARTPRLFEFVPLWNFRVFISYRMRRVECPDCGVKVEQIPWAQGKHACCNVYRHFLATWARRLTWKETAECFRTSWDTVCRSVKWVVQFGLDHRDTGGVEAIGIDEVAYRLGHTYLTLVYQIDSGCRRLLGVVEGRTKKSLEGLFAEFGEQWCAKIKVVCSDMWKPYLEVVADMLPNCLNVLDRFHIVKKLSEAIDQVRREEAARLKREGYEPVLKNSRYCFLKRKANLTGNQKRKLKDILKYNLKIVRAYLLKESFDAFWQYQSPKWAEWFLKKWCARVMRSRIEPMKKFVRTLRAHEELLMNYFKTGKEYSSGIVEGLNRRIDLSIRKAYGYRSFELLKISLFHTLGELPEPEFTHRFC